MNISPYLPRHKPPIFEVHDSFAVMQVFTGLPLKIEPFQPAVADVSKTRALLNFSVSFQALDKILTRTMDLTRLLLDERKPRLFGFVTIRRYYPFVVDNEIYVEVLLVHSTLY